MSSRCPKKGKDDLVGPESSLLEVIDAVNILGMRMTAQEKLTEKMTETLAGIGTTLEGINKLNSKNTETLGAIDDSIKSHNDQLKGMTATLEHT